MGTGVSFWSLALSLLVVGLWAFPVIIVLVLCVKFVFWMTSGSLKRSRTIHRGASVFLRASRVATKGSVTSRRVVPFGRRVLCDVTSLRIRGDVTPRSGKGR